jgi:hypothetical protein
MRTISTADFVEFLVWTKADSSLVEIIFTGILSDHLRRRFSIHLSYSPPLADDVDCDVKNLRPHESKMEDGFIIVFNFSGHSSS